MGGMGPAATVDFLGKLLAASGADRDQDHPRILVDCDPTVPERHAAIRGAGPSPAPRLIAMAQGLERAGAEVLCMPCNTAHAFEADVRAATSAEWVSIVQSTVALTLETFPSVKGVALLAAQGTLDADLYGPALAAQDAKALRLNDGDQSRFMGLLWRIKRGETGPDERAEMRALGARLIDDGAEVVIAACTEVPLVLANGDLAAPMIDSSAALANAVIAAARGA